MEKIIDWALFGITFLTGYYLGGRGQAVVEDIKKQIKTIKAAREKPKPGVVNKLTPEQIEEKRNPALKGNKEAFDRLFREYPPFKS